MAQALVLGAGGHTAIGWEVGVLTALRRAGIDGSRWGYVLGTSAGAWAGARLAFGLIEETFEELTAANPAADRAAFAAAMGNSLPHALALPGTVGKVAVEAWVLGAVARRFVGAARLGGLRSLRRAPAALGRLLGQDSLPEGQMSDLALLAVGLRQRQLASFEAYWAGRLMPGTGWPRARLGIVAFCSSTSRRRVFHAEDGVPLARAIAASTSVPGLLGAVEIGGQHHVDAGPHNSTNVDLLGSDFERVLVLAPDPNPGELERGVPQLEAQGTEVEVLRPSDPGSFGEGIEHLDVGRVPAAVHLGLRDGRFLASGGAPTVW